MRACRLSIKSFRGIKSATVLLPAHGVLIGDNNTGKTTILEALDLVLGPDRLNRQPPIDEHDFFEGRYLAPVAPAVADGVPAGDAAAAPPREAAEAPRIEIEVAIADLTEEQKARFGDYTEFWDRLNDRFYTEPNPAGVDAVDITEALRVTFHGWYEPEEDDFEGRTYFTRSLTEADKPEQFSKKHKQVCGFLYLRSLRTGSRALSLERGSLLDIILRLKEVRPQMWEATLATLSAMPVASDPVLGISPVLGSISEALKKYVPKEWGVDPHLRVSNLTREHLRKVITAFIATGTGDHAAPFYRQGTGTINMLVLAMLSLIAEDKQNVIFAMEEPETAIAPYAQKRIVHEVRKLASQTLFTSHSPHVCFKQFSVHSQRDWWVNVGESGDKVATAHWVQKSALPSFPACQRGGCTSLPRRRKNVPEPISQMRPSEPMWLVTRYLPSGLTSSEWHRSLKGPKCCTRLPVTISQSWAWRSPVISLWPSAVNATSKLPNVG